MELLISCKDTEKLPGLAGGDKSVTINLLRTGRGHVERVGRLLERKLPKPENLLRVVA